MWQQRGLILRPYFSLQLLDVAAASYQNRPPHIFHLQVWAVASYL